MQNFVDSYRSTEGNGFGLKVFFVIILLAGAGVATLVFSDFSFESKKKQDQNIAFLSEIYEKIQENYWEKMDDKKLSALFEKVIENIKKKDVALASQDISGLQSFWETEFKKMSKKEKNEFSVNLAAAALASLPPQGRNRLYGEKKKKELANRVNNINPNKNLYGTLGVEKGASSKDVQKAAKDKKQELAKKEEVAETEEEKQKIKEEKNQVEYAEEVLTDEEKKSIYDTTGKEPTIFKRRLTPDIVHIYIKKFSPTTLQELQKALQDIDTSETTPTSMILDLRANVGGSIDLAPYILGPFIGAGNYAYETYQQSEKEPIKTKIGWMNELVPYKKVVALADGKTQSTGEVFISTLKKYNVGVFVGKTTRGWGTIERVFELKNQIDDENEYGIFLVHHVTLRADGQPIQGRGVNPAINIDSENWKNELLEYFNSETLVEKVEEVWNSDLPA